MMNSRHTSLAFYAAPAMGLDHFLYLLSTRMLSRQPDLRDATVLDLLVRGLVGDILTRARQRAEGQLSDQQSCEADVAACQKLVVIFAGQDERFQFQPGWHGGTLPQHLGAILASHPQADELETATDEVVLQTYFLWVVQEVYEFIDSCNGADEADEAEQARGVVEDIIGRHVHYLRGIPHDQLML